MTSDPLSCIASGASSCLALMVIVQVKPVVGKVLALEGSSTPLALVSWSQKMPTIKQPEQAAGTQQKTVEEWTVIDPRVQHSATGLHQLTLLLLYYDFTQTAPLATFSRACNANSQLV